MAALWWFAMPDPALEAAADGISAAALAGYVETMAVRLGLQGQAFEGGMAGA
jgi:hypothetical protein